MDPAKKILPRQQTKGIINCLSRNRSDLTTNLLGDLVSRAVTVIPNGSKHGETLGCDRNAIFAEKLYRILHDHSLAFF
ncbi:MAG: hypothetical protein ACJAQT_003686 [Akkermansiaceae bacterium]